MEISSCLLLTRQVILLLLLLTVVSCDYIVSRILYTTLSQRCRGILLKNVCYVVLGECLQEKRIPEKSYSYVGTFRKSESRKISSLGYDIEQ